MIYFTRQTNHYGNSTMNRSNSLNWNTYLGKYVFFWSKRRKFALKILKKTGKILFSMIFLGLISSNSFFRSIRGIDLPFVYQRILHD